MPSFCQCFETGKTEASPLGSYPWVNSFSFSSSGNSWELGISFWLCDSRRDYGEKMLCFPTAFCVLYCAGLGIRSLIVSFSIFFKGNYPRHCGWITLSVEGRRFWVFLIYHYLPWLPHFQGNVFIVGQTLVRSFRIGYCITLLRLKENSIKRC
jgi:hypothetical protein